MSRDQVIKVEDTKESMTNALKEMHNAMIKGSGIGFDLRGIKPKGRQTEIMEKFESTHAK